MTSRHITAVSLCPTEDGIGLPSVIQANLTQTAMLWGEAEEWAGAGDHWPTWQAPGGDGGLGEK